MACALVGALCSGNFSNQQGPIVEGLQAELPVPETFSLVSHTTISKLSHASSSRSYTCPSPYPEIKSFYVSALEQRGWRLVRERPIRSWGKSYGGFSLEFSRAEYRVLVQYAGTPEPPYGWDYAISVSWE